MRDLITRENDEVIVARFGSEETFFYRSSSGGNRVNGFSFNIELLNLEGRVETLELVGVDNGGMVEIKMVKIDWVFDFVEDANYDKFCAKKRETFTNGAGTIEELHGKSVSDDGGVGIGVSTKKSPTTKRKWLDLGEAGGGPKNSGAVDGLSGFNGVDGDSDRGNGADGGEFFKGF